MGNAGLGDVDLSTIYTTNGYPGTSVEGAVLRCTEHPEWEIDADGNMLPGLIHRAMDHVKETHPYVHTLDRKFLATRHLAREIREQIEAAAAAGAEVVIDFSGVEAAALGFLDELVCNLAASRPVTVRGMNDDLAESIDLAVGRRDDLGGRVTRA